jgi:hypothetical protein
MDLGLTLPEDVEELERAVREHQAALLGVDPLMAHIGGHVDTHRDHHIRRALAPLARLAEETTCAVLGVAHTNKAPTTDLFAKIGASIGLTGAARSVLLVASDPEQEEQDGPSRVVVNGKNNLEPLAPTMRFRVEDRTVSSESEDAIRTSGIAWCGEAVGVGVRDVLAPDASDERSRLQEAVEFLRAELDGAPVPAARSTLHREQLPLPRNPFEFVRPAIVEVDA